jgi:hypothetical protein
MRTETERGNSQRDKPALLVLVFAMFTSRIALVLSLLQVQLIGLFTLTSFVFPFGSSVFSSNCALIFSLYVSKKFLLPEQAGATYFFALSGQCNPVGVSSSSKIKDFLVGSPETSSLMINVS